MRIAWKLLQQVPAPPRIRRGGLGRPRAVRSFWDRSPSPLPPISPSRGVAHPHCGTAGPGTPAREAGRKGYFLG